MVGNAMRKNLEECDHDQLLEIIAELQEKLVRKNERLSKAQSKLKYYRDKFEKMKDTVAYQRSRIVQLYSREASS
jgi:hypothetical protein